MPAHISTPGSSRFAPRAVGITTPNVKNRTLRSRENASSVQTDLTLAETLVDETSVKVAAPSTKLRGILKYQLVLQFQAERVQEFDELAVLEDLLVENLPSHSVVDGHDFGSGELISLF